MQRAFVLVAGVAIFFCTAVQGANAGFVGMPLNLRSAVGTGAVINSPMYDYSGPRWFINGLFDGPLFSC
jgi:hypothetical protein